MKYMKLLFFQQRNKQINRSLFLICEVYFSYYKFTSHFLDLNIYIFLTSVKFIN